MILKEREEELTKQTLDIIEICRASQGQRTAAYRSYGNWCETGQAAGGLALTNMLQSHLQRLASHLLSPPDMRFAIDFEYHYGKEMLDRASMVARAVTREWERKNIDLLFGRGVYEALKYGCCLLKNLNKENGGKHDVAARLVPPWQFAVFNEGINELSDQEAVVETAYLNEHEVWRRVRNLPDASRLFERIKGSANKDTAAGIPTSLMHQVLSTAVLDVSLQNATRPQPGGIVQLSNDPNFATLGPTVGVQLYPLHEAWVRDDERNDDWTTIQIIEPDILVAPRLKRCNLYCADTLPYGRIQPNEVTDYFWGRSEIVDLMQLQQWLVTHMQDIQRITGQEADRLFAFPGYDGMTDELYAQFRAQGYVGLPPGASATDLTPKLPPEFIPLIKTILELMDRVSGFSNILSGSGEPGVRAGVHADTLMKTASPHLRDRALIVERQCAERGDATLAAQEAKDGRVFWTDDESGERGEFLLSELPDDRRIIVDSHSTSPIYQDDHQQLVAFGVKAGFITGESAIEDLPYQNKDIKIARLREKEKQQQELLAGLSPEERTKVLTHSGGGHGKH
jgi:hypothetical protein